MTTRFLIFDLSPLAPQDQRLPLTFDRRHFPAVRASMRPHGSHLLGPLAEKMLSQLPRDFIANLSGQILDFDKRPRLSQAFFFLHRQLLGDLQNPLAKLTIHDPASVNSPSSGNHNDFPPNAIVHISRRLQSGDCALQFRKNEIPLVKLREFVTFPALSFSTTLDFS
jgi:hypothetical protein